MNYKIARLVRLGLLLLAASTLFYSGCQTAPKQFVSPEAGYLVARYRGTVKGEAAMNAAMNTYARAIAENRLKAIPSGANLPELRARLRALKTPIEIQPEALNQESALSKSLRRTVDGWLRANRQNGIFQGADASETWQLEQAKAEKDIQQMSEQFDAALKRARQAVATGMFEPAMAESQAALRINPEDPDARTLNHTIGRDWATAKLEKALTDAARRRSQAADQVKTYETEQLDAAHLRECEAGLNQAVMQLDDFRGWCGQAADFGQVLAARETELREVEAQLAELRGTAWAQNLWLLRKPHHYWEAYQLFIHQTGLRELELAGNRKHTLTDYERAALHRRPREAYERMLPEGMSFYLKSAASAAEGQGAQGLSLVLCRMAQELLDYAETQHMQLAPEVGGLQTTLKQSLRKAQAALKASLARQLIVKDFQSRGDVGPDLASQIYEEWLKRYFTEGAMESPLPFWQVQVKREAQKTNLFDYVLNGNVKQCYADTLAPKELNVERLDIGLAPELVPNPDAKQAKKDPMIYEQELWIYERRTSQYSKKGIVRADITVTCGGQVTPCVSLNKEFDGLNEKLPGIKLLDQGVENRALNYKPKRSLDRADLKVSVLPANKAAELSSDREIEAALVVFARDQVLASLEVQVAMFPLNTLLQEGLRSVDNPVQAADGFGRCLEYCSQLTLLDTKLTKGEELDWIAWRKALGQRVANLKQAQWHGADPGLAAKIDQLWELSVAAAIQAADQISQAD